MREDFDKSKWTSGPFILMEIDLFIENFCNYKSIYSERGGSIYINPQKNSVLPKTHFHSASWCWTKICAKSKGGEENLTPMA